MRALVDAVADSITTEVTNASGWLIRRHDPVWRNPADGSALSVYSERRAPAPDTPNRWTGHSEQVVEVTVEYAEPANPKGLKRNEEAELAAADVADSLAAWALEHEPGFPPAWRMDWIETSYVPNERREYFSRYCRMTLSFRVTVKHG